jgi:hypothetical protein
METFVTFIFYYFLLIVALSFAVIFTSQSVKRINIFAVLIKTAILFWAAWVKFH